MRLRPRWWIGIAVYIAYAGWVFAAWMHFGIDYASIGSQPNLLRAIALPLGIAAVLLAAFNTLAGWWPQTTREPRTGRPAFLFVLLLPIAGFIGLNLIAAGWGAIGPEHTLVLLGAMLLVGFCEEMVTRGILLVSLRGSLRSEVWAWFGSSALFGLMHATNAFFGLGAVALIQVVAAFCTGTALYLVRRLSGSLWLAMGIHAAWDFSSLAAGLGSRHGHGQVGATVFLVALYAVSGVLLVRVLRRAR